MPKADIYQSNYKRLVQLGICNENGEVRNYSKSRSSGFMDLVLEKLPHLDNYVNENSTAISLAHYQKVNGDCCQDPEMVLFVNVQEKYVEAFSFQQAIPPVYHEVYPEPTKVILKRKKQLNAFLRTWLENLLAQGHGKDWT